MVDLLSNFLPNAVILLILYSLGLGAKSVNNKKNSTTIKEKRVDRQINVKCSKYLE